MSVIAVTARGGKIEIAADSIIVRGWTQSTDTNKYSKLVKVNDLILGSVGLAEEGSLLQAFCATRKPEGATESAIVNFLSEFVE